MKPITPRDAISKKGKAIPDVVIKVVNNLIVSNLSGGQAVLCQEEIVKALVSAGLKRAQIFENDWLDFEAIYEEVGWDVDFDKPGYNESYAATFTFTVKR